MSYITKRKHPHPYSRTRLATSVSLGTALIAGFASPASAQSNATTLAPVTVEGQQIPVEGEYKKEQMASPKFTQPVYKTPRTVQIISDELIQDQHATTLTEALRNSPGVGTFSVGENGATTTGDAVYMRGFDASGSIFVDGVRDLGAISRDTFNTEQVEVIKGPSGADYGRSSPSGSINLVTKKARLGNSIDANIGAGTDRQKRATLDLNRQLNATSAVRLNAMVQDSGVPGRDMVKNKRWGIAPSLSFGLGTDTRLHLNYLHVNQDNIPDSGASTIGLPGWTSPGISNGRGNPRTPTPQFDHTPQPDSSNFYGTDSDFDDIRTDRFSLVVEHDFGKNATFRNVTRWARSDQKYLITSFMADDVGSWTPGDLRNWQARHLVNTRNQANSIITNQTGIVQEVDTGPVHHTLSYGLDVIHEEVKSTGVQATGTIDPVNIYHPSHDGSYAMNANGEDGSGSTDTLGLYLFDTMDFTDEWQVSAGLRMDHYDAEYSALAQCGTGRRAPSCNGAPVGTLVSAVDASTSDTLFGWQLGTLYQINDYGNVYVNYSVAAQPPGGESLALSSRASSADHPGFDPRKAKTLEVGTKWELLDDRLLLTGAVYRTTVNNQVEEDPVSGEYFQTGEKRVQGLEIGAIGQITPNWNLSAGFAIIDAEITQGSPDANDGSMDLPYTPTRAFTSWSTYRFDSGLTLGGGVRYNGGLKKQRDGASGTPNFTESYWVADAMLSYAFSKNMSLQLNVYNLFDKDYVAAINKSGYRYTPGAGRSAYLSLNMRF